MANTYYQPGVYIQEIANLSGTITSVPTAIPAFMGYTEIAQQNAPGDLNQKPFHITSFLEYVKYFGGAPSPSVTSVVIDGSNNFVSADLTMPYKMYNSVQLFYQNGGGDCYIVSAGPYTTPASASVGDFVGDAETGETGCLAPLAMEQEPTLYVFPDNSMLATADFYNVYQQALMQCGTLQSTFLIADVPYDPAGDYDDQVNGANGFRTQIGINDLNYGAAYIPWLSMPVPMTVGYESFKGLIMIGSTPVSALANLTTDPNLQAAANNLDNLVTDIKTITTATTGLLPASSEYGLTGLPTTFTNPSDLYQYFKTNIQQKVGSAPSNLEAVFGLGYAIATQINTFAYGSSPNSILATQLSTYVNGLTQIPSLVTNLASYDDAAALTTPAGLLGGYTGGATAGAQATLNTLLGSANYPYLNNPASVTINIVVGTVVTGDKVTLMVGATTIASYQSASGGELASDIATDLVSNSSVALPSGWGISKFGTEAITVTAPVANGASGNLLTLTPEYTPNVVGATDITFMPAASTGYSFVGGITTLWGTASPFATVPTVTVSGLTGSGTLSNTSQTAFNNVSLFVNAIDSTMANLIQLYNSILTQAQTMESNQETALKASFPVFAAIVNGINNTPIDMPPSGAIAGLYAFVDNARGVWKAPANVSVSGGILGPQCAFANSSYDDLNVDVNAGKSINAIRTFTGKGTLVWGARTLAGNDENYKYVNVRRTLIMIEQSMKDAFSAYVFEPNDAITWGKIRGEAEAYLSSLWKAGALVGTKPEYAYQVQIGLGQTMTSQDILDGLLKVTVLVAISHPAEFIVITIEQLLQQ